MGAVRHVDDRPTMGLLHSVRSEILEAVARHGGSNLRVYGSVVRGTSGAEGDIDLLVDMKEGASLLDLAALHLELEDLLGFPVALSTDVKPRLRDRVRAEAVAL